MRLFAGALLALLGVVLVPAAAMADGGACPRPAAGSEIAQPPDLTSVNGVLETSLSYRTDTDDEGRTLYCFVTPDGKMSPTFHVLPGDRILIHLTNALPPSAGGMDMAITGTVCGDTDQTDTSVNMHFHGMNVTPSCHGDEVIHTVVNAGSSFDYAFRIPPTEPPGLYWYHPHIHGISSIEVQGGASGLIEVEGIANIQPAVSGLPQRYIVLRDEPRRGDLHGVSNPLIPVPGWDVSVNYVTVPFPKYTPATITMQSGQPEFWRVANAAANTIMDLRIKYDGVEQPLQIVGFDGVPTGSQDGTRQGVIVTQTGVLLPPAGRVEFVVAPPGAGVTSAVLETETIAGGPASDSNPRRTLANILVGNGAPALKKVPPRNGPPTKQLFENLADAKVTARRHLYFIEIPSRAELPPPSGAMAMAHGASKAPGGETVNFYIAVEGQPLQLFNPDNPPAIVTTRGAVEEWTIQNRSPEVHEFHIHQIHFLVEEVNGVPIPKDQQQFYDTYQVGFWKGRGRYPSIKVKMDFRGAVVGDFVYHCHILDHEDGGMMAIIRVLPKT
ncbi:MAG: multicopper oxidase domain-containing protein [Alphaproteobacteria bacterium]|nr:multicopper oxidase domain-containing protein [Alphaproteobacteria bacterium]